MRLAGRRQERIQDHRLAVEAEVAALGFEFRDREPPVHAASRSAVPYRPRPVGQFGEEARPVACIEQFDGRVLSDERAPRVDHRPETAGSRLDLRGEVRGRTFLPASPPAKSAGRPVQTACSRPPDGDRTQATRRRRLRAPARAGTGTHGGSALRPPRCWTVPAHRIGRMDRPPQQVEVESRIGTEPRTAAAARGPTRGRSDPACDRPSRRAGSGLRRSSSPERPRQVWPSSSQAQ